MRYTGQNGHCQKASNKCWRGYEEKGSPHPPHTLLLEYKLVQPVWRTVWRFLKKLKIELSHDPAILPLHIYLKKMKTLIKKDTGTPMLITAALKLPRYRSNISVHQ